MKELRVVRETDRASLERAVGLRQCPRLPGSLEVVLCPSSCELEMSLIHSERESDLVSDSHCEV